MLHDFLTANRGVLIDRCRTQVALRRAPRATPAELEFGIPLFLAQLTEMLSSDSRRPLSANPHRDEVLKNGDQQAAIGATRHGDELLRHGFTIDQVVHDYGDLCQSITRLAAEQRVPITVREFHVLNNKLDNAIAGAVTEFARPRHKSVAPESPVGSRERLGTVANEMRNLLNTTILAVAAIKGGSVGFTGATAAALDRSLLGMRALIDRTLAEVRLDEALGAKEVIELAPFILDVQVAAALEAACSGCELTVMPVEPDLFVEADHHILAAAVANLLQNAFEFTRDNSNVLLRAYASKGGRVLIEVQDECGGLPQGIADQLLRPSLPVGQRKGMGSGLPLSRQAVEASGGRLYAKSIPNVGCVFTIDLPQKRLPSAAGTS